MNRPHWIVVVLASALAAVAYGDVLELTAELDGEQPAGCSGTGSAATGTGTFVLDTETGLVDYVITYAGLSSPESAAHVHGPALPCEFAGIVYILPFGTPKIGQAVLTPEQRADMLAGRHFVLIHTVDVPAGEIRGQIRPVFTERPFVRGDGNLDGQVDMGDVSAALAFLFTAGDDLFCADALDTNDDGGVDVADVIFALSSLFVTGAPPIPAPFPDCGEDPTRDGGDCLLTACP